MIRKNEVLKMTKIISDSCTLYTPEEALKKGLNTTPLCIIINNDNYREYVDMTSEKLLLCIKEGAIPSSSQPPIGEKVDLYNDLSKEDDIIDITIADGLSGTYHTAMAARESCDRPEKVSVFNSKTLCGPQRYLVDEALKMAKDGQSRQDILTMLEKSAATDASFLIPIDFAFLKRGGRISKAAAGLGGLLKLVICVKKSDDGKVLEKHSINRTLKGAINSIIQELKKKGVDASYRFAISHADNISMAKTMEDAVNKEFPGAKIDIFPLSPVFITQGGPGCCALQAIKIIH